MSPNPVIKCSLKDAANRTWIISLYTKGESLSKAVSLFYTGMASKSRSEKTRAFRMTYEANRKLILASQELCAICGKPVDKTLKSPDPMSATVDHIIPINKGGHPSDINNLQLAHRACNRAKSDKIGFEKKEEQNFNRNLPQSRNWMID